jgi:hypothetical protein
MKNKWMVHLEKFRKQNKDMDAKDIMQEARKTYKKGGGAVTGYTQGGVANLAGPARGGGVTAYEGSGLASTATRVGGQKSRRRRTSRRTKQSRRR